MLDDAKKSNFNRDIHGKLDSGIEYWRTEEILDLFKTVVDTNLIGEAKKIKKYRDWIAHRNPKKGKPDNVFPGQAYMVLSKILECLDKHPELLKA